MRSSPLEVGGHPEEDGRRPTNTDLEAACRIEPLSMKTTVTAGTSSPLTDGAALALVCSMDYVNANGLTPMARIAGIAVSGCKPETMGLGPIFLIA